jgi:hypothetical protein
MDELEVREDEADELEMREDEADAQIWRMS